MAKTYDNLGLPVTLSLALHGLGVVALGVFLPAPTITPVQRPAIMVGLADIPRVATVRPTPVPSTPHVTPQITQTMITRVAAPRTRPTVVKRLSSRTRASAVARVRSVARPVAPTVLSPSPMALSETIAAASDASPEAITASAIALAHAGTFVLPGAGAVRSKVQMGDNPRPAYPRVAREAGWAGTVIVQVLVLPDGTVGNVTLHRTSGHKILDEAAISAVSRWHFVPAMEGHVSFESVVSLPIRFDLTDAR